MAIINGNGTSETLPGTAAADTIIGAGGNDTALMGGGNDVFIWNFDDGSDTVEGGSGNDRLRFTGTNANELFTIGAFAGGDAGITWNIGGSSVRMDDVERIELQTLGNSDTIRIHDLGTTDVKVVAIDLSGATPGVGDGAIDTIELSASEAGTTIALTKAGGIVSVTGLPAQVTLAAAETTDFLEVKGLGGNDRINAAALPAGVLLTLDGGEGNDSISGSAGDDTLKGGNGNDTVSSGAGKDVIDLGSGNDLFVWNPGDGDDKIDGGDGIDTLRFISGAGNDVINTTYNGGPASLFLDPDVVLGLNHVERMEFRTLGGEDQIFVNSLAGTDVTAVIVDLAGVSGGAAADKKLDEVSVDGSGAGDIIKIASVGIQTVVGGLSAQVSVLHADKTDILNIFGQGGSDTIDAGKLAAGKLALQVFGSLGADTVIGGAGNDFVDGGEDNDFAQLGAGNDFFEWNAGDGHDTIEGQAGTDTAHANGDAGDDAFVLGANGGRALLTYNSADGSLDLNDVERVEIQAVDGDDEVTVNTLAGTDVKLVAVDLGGSDLAFDNVTVNATNGNDKVAVSFAGAVLFAGLPYLVGISGSEADKDSITFNALGGNDVIDASKLPAGLLPITLDGGAGNDTVTGGSNADIVFGGLDKDVLKGAAGADALNGGDGNDVIDGGADDDDLTGNNGDDMITGGAGNDIGLGGAGNDLFLWTVGDGNDTLDGGADFDTFRLIGSKAADAVGITANGLQAVLAAPGGATLNLGVERIEIRPLAGADGITIGDITATNVTQVAVDLASTLGGKAADNTADFVSVASGALGSVSVAFAAGKTVVTNLNSNQIVSVEHSDKFDVLELRGSSGIDSLDASAVLKGAIALQFNAGAGADTTIGGAGNDVFVWNVGDGKDIIDGEAGLDTLRVNGTSTSETTTISAAAGHALFSQVTANAVQDLDDVERIEFHAADGFDFITVNDLSGSDVKQVAIDFADGGVLFGDTVATNGSAGNDAIKVAVAGDVASVTGLSAQVTVAHELDTLRIEINALGGNDSVNGSTLKLNSIQSFAVDGGTGNDTITGGGGNDNLAGGADNDKVLGNGGDDQLFGDAGKDSLDGGAGNDSMSGGTGNDVLTGGAGDDVATGGEGDDTFTGGAGNDVLRYTSVLDGHDVFVGFDGNAAGGQDTLDLDALFDKLGVAVGDRAGRVFIDDNGASVDILIDSDGVGGLDLTIVTLKTSDSITIGQDVLLGS